jgi:hypothetical protein
MQEPFVCLIRIGRTGIEKANVKRHYLLAYEKKQKNVLKKGIEEKH